jgi:outer membrane protein TolC
VSEFREASGLEQERYEAGEVDLIRVEDALLRFYDSQSALADVRIARLLNRVNLHLALGGSFDEQPAVQQPESDAESSDT